MNTPAYLASSIICQPREKHRALFARTPAKALAADATEFLEGINVGRETGLDQALAKDQLLALPDGDATLLCLAGELWLTRNGDIEDYLLSPGQSFAVRRGDRAVVQALQPSRMRLVV
ncbi:MAG: DUF2917 domain-containing protein [Sulfuritalea sp.]|nr:DUF2917 domain-containing protein [Sulfuritalea sp.]